MLFEFVGPGYKLETSRSDLLPPDIDQMDSHVLYSEHGVSIQYAQFSHQWREVEMKSGSYGSSY
jgi:hypothetical protein